MNCQNANMHIAWVSDDNVETVTSWSLALPDTTLIHIFSIILVWSLRYSSNEELRKKFMDLLQYIF